MVNLPILLGLAAHASAVCTRPQLQAAADAYLTALTSGTPSTLPLATTVNYIENEVLVDIHTGILSTPMKLSFNRTLLDTTDCAAFLELNAASNPHPYVLHTRLALTPTTNQINTLDAVISDAGDWIFNATSHLNYTRSESWDPIPESQRDSRAVIKAAADAYLDQWGSPNMSVPLGTPCARLEGGMYTGASNPSANTCAMGAFPQPLHVAKRRYVIDEVLGGVGVLNNFPWLEASIVNGSTPSSNLVRVQGGLIRYIHEVTICVTRMCGR
ncbi:hypothetical protein QBC47DRAFT_360188 [Echria macrotheca]|uniref:DUF8021 domain-containing protein n=1 Tax=Echria macrotheca TaxID=438768 RepID=A0AAJ0BE11_9PEZI|nr:hypothetical protein QBC47DRAFT_360188 [Echria macrotheca]